MSKPEGNIKSKAQETCNKNENFRELDRIERTHLGQAIEEGVSDMEEVKRPCDRTIHANLILPLKPTIPGSLSTSPNIMSISFIIFLFLV